MPALRWTVGAKAHGSLGGFLLTQLNITDCARQMLAWSATSPFVSGLHGLLMLVNRHPAHLGCHAVTQRQRWKGDTGGIDMLFKRCSLFSGAEMRTGHT